MELKSSCGISHPAAERRLRFGTLELERPYFLSPLAGYTNLPFRRVIRELCGVGLCTTDLVNARSLIERNRKALKLIESCPEDKPLAVQIFGSVPEEMRDAALYLESLGAASIDINMGCPVNKVCNVGAGSSLLKDSSAAAHLVRTITAAVKIPVTCKMRLGWDSENVTAPELARALVQAGAAAIFIHGRTRQQGFTGAVSLRGIRAVVEAVPEVPVIGNGDVTTPQAAHQMFQETGCAGISVGRGAFYNPWIFLHIQKFLETGIPPTEPRFEERVCVMNRHLELMIDCFGEQLGCTMFRKVGPWYAKKFGPASEFNSRITRINSRQDYDELMRFYIEWRKPFLDESGELLPRFLPRHALAQPFSDDAIDPRSQSATDRNAIPVPSGPIDIW